MLFFSFLLAWAHGVSSSPSNVSIKGELSQILLSEMSLPGVEVPIEKLLPKMEIGEGEPFF